MRAGSNRIASKSRNRFVERISLIISTPVWAIRARDEAYNNFLGASIINAVDGSKHFDEALHVGIG